MRLKIFVWRAARRGRASNRSCAVDRPAQGRRAIAIRAPLLAVLICAAAADGSAALIDPPQTGYGAPGPFGVTVETFASPLFLGRQVSVYLPTGASGPVPTIFFAHGFNGDFPIFYESLLTHLASRGYGVVFSPYTPLGADQLLRYSQMFAGFKRAIELHPARLDPTRVGFVGHSFGAGALPVLARQGLAGEGWGTAGAFLYSMAPWYSYFLSQAELENFPSHVKLLMQIFDDDRINDHRMAIDVFANINIADSEKDFVTVFSDANAGMTLTADHLTPNGSAGSFTDALDYYGIHRLVDALADYAFTGSAAAKQTALGGGSPVQVAMGEWPDGAPVHPLAVTDAPRAQYHQDEFAFPFHSIFNPRLLQIPEPSGIVLALLGGGACVLCAFTRRLRRNS